MAISITWGMFLTVIYDCLRIFRRVVIHKKIFVMSAEDILFWIFAGFAVFHVTFMVNDGVVRAFSLAGFLIGSFMYQYTVSYYFVKYVAKVLVFLKKFIIKYFLKPLKKLIKSITIIINKCVSNMKGKAAGPHENVRNKEKQGSKKKETKAL